MTYFESFFYKSDFEKSLIFHFSDHIHNSVWMINLKVTQIVSYLRTKPDYAYGCVCWFSDLVWVYKISDLFFCVWSF